MNEDIKDQILMVRDTGKTNMFDVPAVKRIANELELYELANWIDSNKGDYCNFILYGERGHHENEL